jgi:SAM-dependent methyltransferase
MDFRHTIKTLAIGKFPILEIGPSYNPILPKSAGHDVRIMDHAHQDDLIAKYKAYGVDTGKIEIVDYVTTDISSLATYGERYALIVASHVIEHSTDIIKFLNDCYDLLTEDGELVLIIPDKRYCFDTFRPLSSAGMAIDAHLENRTLHRGAVFDHYAHFCTRSGAMAWGEQEKGSLSLTHSSDQNIGAYSRSLNPLEYEDAHEWIFTPSSFGMVIQDLRACELIKLNLKTLEPTIGYEFLSILTNRPAADAQPRFEYMKDIQLEELHSILMKLDKTTASRAYAKVYGENHLQIENAAAIPQMDETPETENSQQNIYQDLKSKIRRLIKL